MDTHSPNQQMEEEKSIGVCKKEQDQQPLSFVLLAPESVHNINNRLKMTYTKGGNEINISDMYLGKNK